MEEKLILEISINVIVFEYNWETPPKTTLFNLAFNIGRKIAVVNIVFVINAHTFYNLYDQSLEHEYWNTSFLRETQPDSSMPNPV